MVKTIKSLLEKKFYENVEVRYAGKYSADDLPAFEEYLKAKYPHLVRLEYLNGIAYYELTMQNSKITFKVPAPTIPRTRRGNLSVSKHGVVFTWIDANGKHRTENGDPVRADMLTKYGFRTKLHNDGAYLEYHFNNLTVCA